MPKNEGLSVMETLLCRRVDLALASGEPLEGADPVVQHHVAECERCQETLRMDLAIAGTLRGSAAPLPQKARRRIEALVHLKAREEAGGSRPDYLAAVAGLAALLMVVLGLGQSASLPTTEHAEAPRAEVAQPPEPALVSGEHLTGLGELVARHRGGDQTGPSLPAEALLYQSRLPRSLAEQLLLAGSDGLDRASWDGLPVALSVEEATLFVLARSRVRLDPIISEVLDEVGTLTLPFGPHQVTFASRDGSLFVIITTPAGLEAVAQAPYL